MAGNRELAQKWNKLCIQPHVKEWEDRNVFYKWCHESGYQPGDKLTRIDKTKPFGPDNCRWRSGEGKIWIPSSWDADFCRRWARGVNPLRKLAGLSLLPED